MCTIDYCDETFSARILCYRRIRLAEKCKQIVGAKNLGPIPISNHTADAFGTEKVFDLLEITYLVDKIICLVLFDPIKISCLPYMKSTSQFGS